MGDLTKELLKAENVATVLAIICILSWSVIVFLYWETRRLNRVIFSTQDSANQDNKELTVDFVKETQGWKQTLDSLIQMLKG